jgi:hypothetical protein
MNCLLKCMCNRITGVIFRGIWISDTPIAGNWTNNHARYSYGSVWNSDTHTARNRSIWVSEFQTPIYSFASYMGVWIPDNHNIFYCELYGCLKFRHPYILLRVIWVSEFQTPLYSIASYMGVWNSDTLIFYCELYGCLNFRHTYILLQVIWVSEFQTTLCWICVSEFQTTLYSIANCSG